MATFVHQLVVRIRLQCYECVYRDTIKLVKVLKLCKSIILPALLNETGFNGMDFSLRSTNNTLRP